MKKILILIISLLVTVESWAEVPKLFNYSGKLTDKSNNIVTDGDYDMIFTLYDGLAGPAVWTENHDAPSSRIHVTAGAFNVLLGGITALPTFEKNYYLEMKFKKYTDPPSAYETFPRQQIISVPYALQANDGVPKGAIIMWTGTSCPPGYTRLSAFDGMFPRGAANYGATGGSDTHNHGGSTGLTGSHSHTYSTTAAASDLYVDMYQGGGGPIYGCSTSPHVHSVNGTTSTNGDHSHTISSNSNVPRYFNVLFCLKN